MRLTLLAAAGSAAAAGAVVPASAGAAGPGSVVRVATVEPVVDLTERAHDRAARRNVRLARSNDRLRGERPDADRREELEDWSVEHLRDRNRALARKNRSLKRLAARRARTGAVVSATATGAAAPAGGATATPGHLQAIANCESGGDPSAVGGGGQFRGKYQFDLQTWQSVGGAGDPASAPEAEQDARAAALYAQRGASPWPVCGG